MGDFNTNPPGRRSERSVGDVLDRRLPNPDPKEGLSVEVLVHNGHVFEEPEYYGDARPEQIATELRDLTQAERVRVRHIDPTVGAGTNGLSFLLQFLETGAVVITWAFAVKAIAPKIRRAMAHLQSLSMAGHPVTVSLSSEALQVLVAAEVCTRHQVNPSEFLRFHCISHEADLSESRHELRQLYSAHTITVEAIGRTDTTTSGSIRYHHKAGSLPSRRSACPCQMQLNGAGLIRHRDER